MTNKITPELIPHADFHKGKWLLPIERPEWYYFLRQRSTHHTTARAFLKSVDKPLRSLVRFLHRKGIKTTPSCAGHHFSERNLERVYDNLEKDRDDIVGQGLRLKDVETGKEYLFRNKNYTLPWSRSEFVRRATAYQLNGIIGMRIDKRLKARKRILELRIPGATITEKDSMVFIHSRMDQDATSNPVWQRVTKAIKKILRKKSISKTLPQPTATRMAA